MAVSRREWVGLAALVVGVSTTTRWCASRDADMAGADVAAAARAGDIRMLSSVTCPVCMRARRWLVAHAIPFDECYIERDAACRAEFERRGAGGTPLFVVRGRTLVGFDPKALREVLRDSAASGAANHRAA